MAARSWYKQVAGTLHFLEELDDAAALHGEVWKKRMNAYYVARVETLLTSAPKGVEKYRREFERRLKAVRSNS